MPALTLPLLLCFFHHTPPPEIYTLSLHDALPICPLHHVRLGARHVRDRLAFGERADQRDARAFRETRRDRKSTRLNSSHRCISYAVFCLKKKKHAVCTSLPRQ